MNNCESESNRSVRSMKMVVDIWQYIDKFLVNDAGSLLQGAGAHTLGARSQKRGTGSQDGGAGSGIRLNSSPADLNLLPFLNISWVLLASKQQTAKWKWYNKRPCYYYNCATPTHTCTILTVLRSLFCWILTSRSDSSFVFSGSVLVIQTWIPSVDWSACDCLFSCS